MKLYQKGYRSERELLRFLSARGYSCIRSASSGGFLTPVDVVAIKGGQVLAFEIKSHAKRPRLKKDQLERFSEWCEKANAMGFVAWRRTSPESGDGAHSAPLSASQKWLFLPVESARNNNYSDENWVERDVLFLRVFGIE